MSVRNIGKKIQWCIRGCTCISSVVLIKAIVFDMHVRGFAGGCVYDQCLIMRTNFYFSTVITLLVFIAF